VGNHSKQIAEVRKHLNLVTHANEYENKFLVSKEATTFTNSNPMNVYYQIVQGGGQYFNPVEYLTPATLKDV
jgi:hypothetical protein